LHEITEDERKDHIKYRDSNVKRWIHKLQGSKGKDKFSSKQEKEEREFQEAWQNERSARESRAELARTLSNAEDDHKRLISDAQRQNKAQKELDDMYASIFSGPTPEIPGEDQAEEAVNLAKGNLSQAQDALNKDKTAMQYMDRCRDCLTSANAQMDEALSLSTWDVVGGGTFTDMMERDALAQSQNSVHIAIRHLDTARNYQPQIRELDQVQIDQGHFFSDVMFDNIFTDMRQHERIEKAKMDLQQATHGLEVQAREQGERLRGSRRNVTQAKSDLEEARRSLQEIRAESFGRLAGEDGNDASTEAPPAYSAVS